MEEAKRGPGQPTKFTPDIKKIILNAIAGGNYLSTAFALAGIHHQTFYNWEEKADAGEPEYVEFFDQIKKAEAYAEADRVKNIKQAADGGNWTASAWLLERKTPDRWGKKDKLEADVNHSGGISFNISFDKGMGEE